MALVISSRADTALLRYSSLQNTLRTGSFELAGFAFLAAPEALAPSEIVSPEIVALSALSEPSTSPVLRELEEALLAPFVLELDEVEGRIRAYLAHRDLSLEVVWARCAEVEKPTHRN